ncbi:unnamed protein product [Cylicostephanus goldi]|uniref:RRM domain-containing protein n=1 Tax=Cylicostephanus goldi TaxID=71465 RepID=A0A3P6RSJ9_CYLGO|nr:unnamed protein product [Cylicostephanus goldi]
MCTRHNGRLTVTMPMGNSQSANIHIRVWYTRDAKYYSPEFNESMLKTNKNCAFVGGIPRTMTAKQLAEYMSITYGDVLFARIEVELETDYPKGAGCVMFRYREAFVTAVASRFVSLNFGDHIKQVEIQPYLMRPVECEICQAVKTRNFCPKFRCLKFMCELCWRQAHVGLPDHYPLMRSPPLRLRGLTANVDDHKTEHYANDGAPHRSTSMLHYEGAYNTHNLCNVVNSIQFPPVSLFEVESHLSYVVIEDVSQEMAASVTSAITGEEDLSPTAIVLTDPGAHLPTLHTTVTLITVVISSMTIIIVIRMRTPAHFTSRLILEKTNGPNTHREFLPVLVQVSLLLDGRVGEVKLQCDTVAELLKDSVPLKLGCT